MLIEKGGRIEQSCSKCIRSKLTGLPTTQQLPLKLPDCEVAYFIIISTTILQKQKVSRVSLWYLYLLESSRSLTSSGISGQEPLRRRLDESTESLPLTIPRFIIQDLLCWMSSVCTSLERVSMAGNVSNTEKSSKTSQSCISRLEANTWKSSAQP